VDKLKKYGGHALAYGGSIIALLAAHPEVLPPNALQYVGIVGLVLTALANSHAAGVKLPVGAVVKSFALLAVLSVMVACASFSKAVNDNPVVATVAVQYATGKVIEAGKTPAARQVRAERVVSIASKVKEAAKGRVVTLDELQAVAQGYVAELNLEPADAMLANTVVLAVVAELHKKIETGALNEADQVVLTRVLDWSISAANIYIPKS
jgi:hypothetical protein